MKHWNECAKLQWEADSDSAVQGQVASCAANIVMKILPGARFVRMDLLRIIGFLACQFTRWTPACNKRLFRLVFYCNTTVKTVQIAWIGICLINYSLACTLTRILRAAH